MKIYDAEKAHFSFIKDGFHKLWFYLQVSRLTDLVTNQKTSNFALSQEVEAATEKLDELLVDKENLQNQIERTAYAHAEEKIKLESTLAQQTKLIDFLNAKVVEDAPKGKKGKVRPPNFHFFVATFPVGMSYFWLFILNHQFISCSDLVSSCVVNVVYKGLVLGFTFVKKTPIIVISRV